MVRPGCRLFRAQMPDIGKGEPMRSIALINQKGGVGKTTSTANIGACLALKGRRVLIVDIDPQANLTAHFGLDIYESRKTIYNLLTGDAEAEDTTVGTDVEGLDLVPSDINLAGAEIELVGVVGRETILKEAIKPVLERYDYVLCDCPPSLGLLTLNALTTVEEVFIPVQTEFFALQGMSKLLETVEIVRKRINRSLNITGIIACMFDTRTSLGHEVLNNIREYFGDLVFRTVIRKNVRLAESPSHGKPIIHYDSRAAGSQDYMALADEILAQEKGAGAQPGSVESPSPAESAAAGETQAPCAGDMNQQDGTGETNEQA